MFQGDVGKLQMDKGQIVADFLFPTDKKTPCAVRPGMAAFDDPATGAAAGTTLDLNLALARDVQNVSQTPRKRLRGLGAVAFIQTQMLPTPSDRLGPPHGHRPQRGMQQRDVMRVRASEGDADRHAAGVGHVRSFDAEFTAIGRVFAGFFPRPAVPWSWNRPTLANATQFRAVRHTSEDIFSRNDKRRGDDSIPENTDARCLKLQTAAAAPSTDSQCVTNRGCRWRRIADLREVARLWDCVDTWATMAQSVATFSQASAQNDYTNRNSYSPPCEEQVTFLSCSTPSGDF